MFYDEEDVKYAEEIVYDIKCSVSLLGVVNSYFKSCDWQFSEGVGELKLKVFPENKFFYNYCPFHRNGVDNFAFFVDERVQLFYCFGCGKSGNVIDFFVEVFNLDINTSIELSCVIGGLFDVSVLDEKTLHIYTMIMKHYNEKDELLDMSEKKTNCLKDRINRYLVYYCKRVTDELSDEDFLAISKRLCCDERFVRRVYFKSEVYKMKREQYKLLKEKETIEFQ